MIYISWSSPMMWLCRSLQKMNTSPQNHRMKGLTRPRCHRLTRSTNDCRDSHSNWLERFVPVTIHDVARRAKVSASTVSRALSASHHVRGTTRDRVLAAARELGYQPNPAAQSLITGKTGNIGIVVPDLGNPF